MSKQLSTSESTVREHNVAVVMGIWHRFMTGTNSWTNSIVDQAQDTVGCYCHAKVQAIEYMSRLIFVCLYGGRSGRQPEDLRSRRYSIVRILQIWTSTFLVRRALAGRQTLGVHVALHLLYLIT